MVASIPHTADSAISISLNVPYTILGKWVRSISYLTLTYKPQYTGKDKRIIKQSLISCDPLGRKVRMTKKVHLSEERATGKKGEVKVHLHVTILVNKLFKT